MTPGTKGPNIVDRRAGDTVLGCDLSSRAYVCPDGSHKVVVKAGLVMPRPAHRTSLGDHVGRVVLDRSHDKVVRPYAPWGVTAVQNDKAVNVAVVMFGHDAVREDGAVLVGHAAVSLDGCADENEAPVTFNGPSHHEFVRCHPAAANVAVHRRLLDRRSVKGRRGPASLRRPVHSRRPSG